MWQVPRRLPESISPQRQQPIRPAPPACVVPLVIDHVLYPCTHTPPRLPQPHQRGLRLLPQWFRRSRTHPHRFISCAHPPLVFPITRRFRPNGTQMNFVCGFLFGIFPRNTDPHPPSPLAQTPPSYAPTGPSAIQPKHPRTHLPSPHQPPERLSLIHI